LAAHRGNPLAEIAAEIELHIGCCTDLLVVEQDIVAMVLVSVLAEG
jgi:hypothetical protein